MKTLLINGSPKGERSDTMHLTKAFLEGAKLTDVEVIDISKLNVRGCMGCYTCWTKTPGKCVIKDEMADILPKFISAKVIIWSFPLYACHFPGQMKCFMDRMLPLSMPEMDTGHESGNHPTRFDMSAIKGAYISTCGFWTARGNYDSIISLLERNGGNHADFTIFSGQGALFGEADSDPELKQLVESYLNLVRRAGEELMNGKISEETHVALCRPLLPKEIYESFANTSWDE